MKKSGKKAKGVAAVPTPAADDKPKKGKKSKVAAAPLEEVRNLLGLGPRV